MSASQSARLEYLPVHRYYDALEGPELDTLRASEELVLPEDLHCSGHSFSIIQFLHLVFALVLAPKVSFGRPLQPLWQRVSSTYIDLDVNLILWFISAVLTATVSFIYSLKIIFYFDAVRPPNSASVAWVRIVGNFGYASRISYFVALFLYITLAVRVNFFRGFKFSLAWWAYTFPMTGTAIATIKYSN
ncbi:hypothetical protein IFM89_026540 [Coptis chinensis]|uniref:Uncharacterized protein n=1 Tax=Coptis chinensis TaxID=261450 RepID=A0A835LP84_9MAGN|nr:hypothetical protein IFM89_026540 [Coptis chinensis]